MNEKQQKPVTLLTVTGLFAAIITLMTAYICHIPYGANGGYIHFGDALIYVAAVILPRPYAMAAAAIGGGLADLLTAPMWAPARLLSCPGNPLWFLDICHRFFCRKRCTVRWKCCNFPCTCRRNG